jgi:5-oxoprolinase (ATP-hydrolysing)/N-methylhydantoinase A
MPVFNLTLPRAVRALLEFFPGSDLHDGDVLITNDPWVCAGHLFDLAVVTPVYRRGRLAALVGSIAHCSDIGGTKDSWRAREVYDEGLQIPPLRLYHRGELNRELAALIRRNVRNPEMVFGDIQAQVGANRVGAERLLAFMTEYNLESLEPLAREVQARAEGAMRRAVAAVPDGTYEGHTKLEVLGERLRLGCAITVDGEELTVDWRDVPPQLPIGGMNCTYSYAAAHTVYALKSILTPDIPSNAGCFRPLHVRAPEGSVLNARYPAAVNQRTMVGWFCGPAIFRALAPVLPDRVQAFTGLPASGTAYGRDARGRIYNDHIMFAGGQGASRHGDGHAALMYPTSAGNVPVEMFEQRTPLLVERKELIPDTGGPGTHRGGLGQRLVLRKADAAGPPVLVNVLPHGMGAPMTGLLGGGEGGQASFTVLGGAIRDGTARNGRPETTLVELSDARGAIVVEASGGSGFGDPVKRPLELVAADLAEGYITPEGLVAYGAGLSPSGVVVRRAAPKRPSRRGHAERRGGPARRGGPVGG